jgi:hypothetical protein
MGEYVTINKQQVKLGTCEDLYYTRLNQLWSYSHIQGVKEYLNPDNGFRYRFPFPEEDNLTIGNYNDFDKGLIISLHADDYRLVDFSHDDIWHGCSAENKGSYNVNISLPCPQSKALDWTFIQMPDNTTMKIKHSNNDFRIVSIKQQKQVNGEVWTVISCPYCGSRVRIDYDGAVKLVHSIKVGYIDCHNATESNKEYYTKVIDRIMQGYKIPIA